MTSEEVIFTINGDGTITTIIGATFLGDPEAFSWAFAVPPGTTIDFVERESLEILRRATEVQIIEPMDYCSGIFVEPDSGDWQDYLRRDDIRPVDDIVIDGDDAEEAFIRLRDNGYPINEDMIPVIAEYTDIGMVFITLKYRPERDEVDRFVETQFFDPPAVVMTYEADTLLLPIRLSAPIANEHAGISLRVWIFADVQYVPENFAHPIIDYSLFRGPRQIVPYDRNFVGHEATLEQFRDDYDGLAFVTDYAQPTASLELDEEDALITDLIERFPYVTRLQGRIFPEQMTLDPVFTPAPDAPDVSNVVDLNDYVDPLQYWGCSTRAVQDIEAEALIEGFIPEGERFPEGWTTQGGLGFRIISPEPVTHETVDAFLRGEETPSMLVLFGSDRGSAWDTLLRRDPYSGFCYGDFDPCVLELHEDQCAVAWSGIHYPLYSVLEFVYPRGSHTVLLTTQEDCDENDEQYDAMVTYWQTYPYYAHPELRHTLFLGNAPYYSPGPEGVPRLPPLYFGFPEGWVEQAPEEGHFVIRPEEMVDNEDAPSIELFIHPYDTESIEAGWDLENRQAIVQELAEIYNLSDDALAAMMAEVEQGLGCTFYLTPVEFESGGRRGYIVVKGDYTHQYYLLEASAPSELFDQYADDLRNSAESLKSLEAACG